MKNHVFEVFTNVHRGQRVFLIGNGPSLADTDLDLLKDEISIAMNRVELIYNENPDWRPTYYLFSSTNVRNSVWGEAWTDSVRRAIAEERTTSFIAKTFKSIIDPQDAYPQVRWFESMSEQKPRPDGSISEECFSTDIVDRIDKSGTTMNLALQLAYHMGFAELVFVGTDLAWTADPGSAEDPNHFDRSYRANIAKPYKANHQMRNIHSLAYKSFMERDRSVAFYNCSLRTVLDVYPVIDYESYVRDNSIVVLDERLERAKRFWDRPHQFLIEDA